MAAHREPEGIYIDLDLVGYRPNASARRKPAFGA